MESSKSKGQKQETSKITRRNIFLSKEFSNDLTNTINSFMKKNKSNSHSRNNIVNLNDTFSNNSKKNMGIISYRISSKHNLRQQINGDINSINNERFILPKSYTKSWTKVDNNRRKDTKTKKYEFNSINNKGEIEPKISKGNNYIQNIAEDVKLLINEIKNTNDLMDKRQEKINFEKLIEAQKTTN